MNPPLHDTHFHLDLFERPREVMEKIEQEKVYTVAVTNVPEVFEHTHSLVKGSKYIRAALGLHPELAAQHRHQLPLFQELLSETKYVGEVGLDNYKKSTEDFHHQKQVFEKILLACGTAKGKILTVHSRRAEKEIIDMIGVGFPGKIILHWYSGLLTEVDRALSRGFYFSINYAMTQSESGKRLLLRLPKDRILLETDGPFVKIKNIPATPETVGKTVESIFLVRKSEPPQMCEAQIYNNFRALIS